MRNFPKFVNLHQFTKSCSSAIELPFAHLRPLSCQWAAVDPSAAVRLPLGRRWALALYLCTPLTTWPLDLWFPLAEVALNRGAFRRIFELKFPANR